MVVQAYLRVVDVCGPGVGVADAVQVEERCSSSLRTLTTELRDCIQTVKDINRPLFIILDTFRS